MRRLGTIIRLQVQQSGLKQGEGATRYYDPAPIISVAALRVEPGGVIGLLDGEEIVDVHHAAHPASKFRDLNGISVNFTGHYAAMAARFGPHLTPGIAGENLLVEAPDRYGEADLGTELVVQTCAGGEIRLTSLCVAAPCAPFGRFALALDSHAPPEMTRDALQFLHHGTRGFYTTYSGEPAVIQLGDELLTAQAA